MKNWVKDGFLVLGIIVVYSLFLGLINFFAGGVTRFAESSGEIILFFVNFIGSLVEINLSFGLILIWIITPIIWFAIGSLIGLIVRKVRK